MILKLSKDKKLTFYRKNPIYIGEKDFDTIEVLIPFIVDDNETNNLNFILHLVNKNGEYLHINLDKEIKEDMVVGSTKISSTITNEAQNFFLYLELIKENNEVIGKTNCVEITIEPLPDEDTRIISKEEYEETIDELTEIIQENTEAMNRINEFEDGKSAYEIAVEHGYEGTEEDWLQSLNGKGGKSAYEIAIEQGYEGTEEEWLSDMKDYSELNNKPKINGKTISSDKQASYYGLIDNEHGYTKAETEQLITHSASLKESLSNKVQSIGSQSQTGDNDKYPSVTAVRDYVNTKTDDLGDYIDNERDYIDNVLDGFNEAKADKVEVFDAVVRNYQDVTPDITFDIHNTAIATYLTESAVYSPNDYDVTKVPTSLSGTPYDTPNTTTIDLPTGSSKVILYDTVAKTEQVISVSGSTYTITNLIPNRVYAYTVRNSSGTMLSYGTVKATGHIRMIDGGGNTFNIRDLGGWTCDGGKTKYGLIYRGAELNGAVSLNSSQVDFFKNVLGIRDEIDLRNPTGTGVGSGALGLGVDYVNIYTNYSPYALQDLYRQERVDIIKRIAKNIKEKKVTYIHCSAGADRTAIICTFIEAICGVSQNDIDRDYELTAFAYDTNNNRLSTRTRNNTWFNGHRVMINGDGTESYSYPYINNMEGSSFQDKIVRFLLRSGVTIDELNDKLNDIRFGLIDGNPTKLTNPYGAVTITKTLPNITIDNQATTMMKYQPFEATLSVDD